MEAAIITATLAMITDSFLLRVIWYQISTTRLMVFPTLSAPFHLNQP